MHPSRFRVWTGRNQTNHVRVERKRQLEVSAGFWKGSSTLKTISAAEKQVTHDRNPHVNWRQEVVNCCPWGESCVSDGLEDKRACVQASPPIKGSEITISKVLASCKGCMRTVELSVVSLTAGGLFVEESVGRATSGEPRAIRLCARPSRLTSSSFRTCQAAWPWLGKVVFAHNLARRSGL